MIGACFHREMLGFAGERVAFVQAAGAVDPIGFAAELDGAAYRHNVLLNSVAPQVLGQRFLAAARSVRARRHLVMLTSGAARLRYPGLAAYGAGKAAIDHWVRTAGSEQDTRGGVQVLSIVPGSVDTAMHQQLRGATPEELPHRQKFLDLQAQGRLGDPTEVARQIWALVDRGLDNGSVVDLRGRDVDSATLS